MSEFFDLLLTRRSIRDYEDKQVSPDLIMEIIRDATMAPSSGNGQPWRFVVVQDKEFIKRMSDESKSNLLAAMKANPSHPSRKYEGVLGNDQFNVFYNAPSLVVIVGPRELRSVYVDCTLAASYFMLSAAARGLGTCWINLGADIRDPEMLEALGITPDLAIVAPIILGYPKKIPPPPHRNDPLVIKTLD